MWRTFSWKSHILYDCSFGYFSTFQVNRCSLLFFLFSIQELSSAHKHHSPQCILNFERDRKNRRCAAKMASRTCKRRKEGRGSEGAREVKKSEINELRNALNEMLEFICYYREEILDVSIQHNSKNTFTNTHSECFYFAASHSSSALSLTNKLKVRISLILFFLAASPPPLFFLCSLF